MQVMRWAIRRSAWQPNAAVRRSRSRYRTALMAATIFEHIEVARALVEHGADVDARGPMGFALLKIARNNNNAAMLEFLEANGAE